MGNQQLHLKGWLKAIQCSALCVYLNYTMASFKYPFLNYFVVWLFCSSVAVVFPSLGKGFCARKWGWTAGGNDLVRQGRWDLLLGRKHCFLNFPWEFWGKGNKAAFLAATKVKGNYRDLSTGMNEDTGSLPDKTASCKSVEIQKVWEQRWRLSFLPEGGWQWNDLERKPHGVFSSLGVLQSEDATGLRITL